jgi:hypothetical protein
LAAVRAARAALSRAGYASLTIAMIMPITTTTTIAACSHSQSGFMPAEA